MTSLAGSGLYSASIASLLHLHLCLYCLSPSPPSLPLLPLSFTSISASVAALLHLHLCLCCRSSSPPSLPLLPLSCKLSSTLPLPCLHLASTLPSTLVNILLVPCLSCLYPASIRPLPCLQRDQPPEGRSVQCMLALFVPHINHMCFTTKTQRQQRHLFAVM